MASKSKAAQQTGKPHSHKDLISSARNSRRKKPILESEIQRQCMEYLRSLDKVMAIKVIVANQAGCPDILACFNGSFAAIEVKRPGEQPTTLQSYVMDRMACCGARVIVVHSQDELKEWVEKTWLGLRNV
jgi:hypothetical protein